MAILPLIQADLRLLTDHRVTVSDASETGGGVCLATGLTETGYNAFRRELALAEGIGGDTVGLVGGFEGIGGARRALEILGIRVTAHFSIEIDPRAQRVTAAAWPGATAVDDIKSVTVEQLREWLWKYPHLKLILVVGGSPCQGVSGLNANALGMLDPRTTLVNNLVDIYWMLKRLASMAGIELCVENVASMDQHGTQTVQAFNALLGSTPSDIDAADSGDMGRPRRYWHSWPIVETADASIEPKAFSNKVTLVGNSPDHVRTFDNGAVRVTQDATKPFATFVRAIPRRKPPPSPRGIHACDEETLRRWERHGFRYPPYQYKEGNGVYENGSWRPLNANERERRMGYEAGHTLAALTRQERNLPGLDVEDIRCALVGNAFYVPAVAWLIGHCLVKHGIMASIPTVAQCWGEPPTEAVAALDERLDNAGGGPDAVAAEVIRHTHRNCMFKGCDVRLATGILHNPGLWPRKAISASRWNWKIVVAYPMHGRHINVQEMEAILSSLKWRTRSYGGLGRRSVHFVDSQVCMSVLAKGRSSSRQLRTVLLKINALVLAANLAPALCYVRSADNPADRPSRWKRWRPRS